MHGLETIHAMNAVADAKAIGPRRPETPMLNLLVVAVMGVIKITGQKQIEGNWVHFEKIVNAANPLLDQDLVDFHRTWDGPKYIAGQVEAHASQHRRMISAEGLWEDCQKEAAAHRPALAA
jgi:hypothetical protein